MKYRIAATKSKYLLKDAMYKLTYEKLKDDPTWTLDPFTFTFMQIVPSEDTLMLGWVSGMTASLSIIKDEPFFFVEQRKADCYPPRRKVIEVTFDELFDFGLVEIVPDEPRKNFFRH